MLTLALKAAWRFLNGNVWLALGVAGAALGLYTWLAWYYYDLGYAAHQAEVAAEIRTINKAREDLTAQLSHERIKAAAERERAVADAIAGVQSYCQENPEACGIAVATAGPAVATRVGLARPSVAKPAAGMSATNICGLPGGVLASLNRIK